MKLYKFFIYFIILSKFSNAEILMSPYIQAISENSVTIMLECDSKIPPKALFGKTEKLGLVTFAKAALHTEYKKITYIHRIILDNLESGQEYFYQVQHDNGKISNTYSFKTIVKDKKSLKIAIYGDNRSNPKMFSKITDNVIKKDPDFMLLTGDLSYSNSYNTYKEEFFTESNLRLLSGHCFYNATGNHEGWSNNTKAFILSPKSSSNTDEYYSIEFGDFLILNLNQYVNYKPNSEQWKFVEKSLKESKAKYKFVSVHKPAYCAGSHGDDAQTKEMSEKLFSKYGVFMVFAGHSHFYQRNFIDGVYHFVLGGAGAPLYEPENATYTQKSIKSHHYSILEINQGKVLFTVYDQDDKIIDRLELEK